VRQRQTIRFSLYNDFHSVYHAVEDSRYNYIICNLQQDLAMKVTFSKHKGKHLVDLDTGYLRWIIANDVGGTEFRNVVRDILAARNISVPNETGLVDQLQERVAELEDINLALHVELEQSRDQRRDLDWWPGWWRRAVMVAHPDRGGSDAMMALLNEATTLMRR
jgi:uncharacterized protein (DUF3820 family)